MRDFILWNSQSLDKWAEKYAEGKFIDLNGRITHYTENGEGSGIILIHGYFLDSNTWAHNVDDLAKNFRTIVPDLWGSGYSTRDPLDYGYQLFTEQIRQLMDALQIEKASFLDHSMGGGTAIKFTINHSHRVQRLILVDSAGIPYRLPLRIRLFNLPGVSEFLMGLRTDAFRRKNLADLRFHKNYSLPDQEFENLTRFHKIIGTTECLVSILRKTFFQTLGDEIEQLAGLNIPIMIVWGKEDRAVPLHQGKEMHRILQGLRMEIFDQSGHMSNFERPEKFNELAINFLQQE